MNLYGIEKTRFLCEWDNVRFKALRGVKKMGHDIPITGYPDEDITKIKRRKNSRKNLTNLK